MRKYAVQVTLTSLHGLALALAILFYLVMRPDLLASYGAHGFDLASVALSLPATARWALSWWLVPAGSTVEGALVVARAQRSSAPIDAVVDELGELCRSAVAAARTRPDR